MARTREVSSNQWEDFFHQLSKRGRDRPVRVEVGGADLGSQHLGEHLALIGFELESRGSEAGSLEMAFATELGELRHQVSHPARVFVQETDAGQLACVEVEDLERVKTLVYFEDLPQLPEHEAPAP